jgi:hypothetical protein
MGIGWSTHRNGGWRGQLDRIHRWHARVVKAAKTGSAELEDFIFVLFQNCHHLREWLEKTSTIPKDEITAFFTKTKELRLCRDLCNGTKHMSLKSASVDAGFSIGREYARHEPGGARMVLIADDKYDLLELASRCVVLIDDFTKKSA